MNVLLASIDMAWENKNHNMILCENILDSVSVNQIDLVIFPEMTLTGFSMNTQKIVEDIQGSKTINFFKNLALKKKINIIFGMVLKRAETNNVSICVDSSGSIVNISPKIHPFSFSHEDLSIKPGDSLDIYKIKDFSVMNAICYDLRFPEIFSARSKYIQAIIVIANWPHERNSIWRNLLAARAIENQSYVIGVNRTGADINNLNHSHSSAVFLPDGTELNPKKNDGICSIYSLQSCVVKSARQNMKVLNDRRPSFYSHYLKDENR